MREGGDEMETVNPLSLTMQKKIAFAAVRNYAKSLRATHDFRALKELRNGLKAFADALTAKKKA